MCTVHRALSRELHASLAQVRFALSVLSERCCASRNGSSSGKRTGEYELRNACCDDISAVCRKARSVRSTSRSNCERADNDRHLNFSGNRSSRRGLAGAVGGGVVGQTHVRPVLVADDSHGTCKHVRTGKRLCAIVTLPSHVAFHDGIRQLLVVAVEDRLEKRDAVLLHHPYVVPSLRLVKHLGRRWQHDKIFPELHDVHVPSEALGTRAVEGTEDAIAVRKHVSAVRKLGWDCERDGFKVIRAMPAAHRRLYGPRTAVRVCTKDLDTLLARELRYVHFWPRSYGLELVGVGLV
eukprot:4798083-Pleurochrysis_carterae.AAC.2